MPRPRRMDIIAPDSAAHVIVRGNNRRRLFSFPRDYLWFLGILGFESRRRAVPVHALALMSNHVHLVVTTPDAATLSRFMKSVAQRHAQRRNAARGATGKLFEQRYESVPILDDAQLAVTIAYVDLNPVRAGVVDAAAHHPWSSYRQHAGEGVPHPSVTAVLTPHAWYLALAGNQHRRELLYRSFVEDRRREGRALDEIAQSSSDRDDEATPYTLRLRRPDDSRVAETRVAYGVLVREPGNRK